jgi:hypothetical protein
MPVARGDFTVVMTGSPGDDHPIDLDYHLGHR